MINTSGGMSLARQQPADGYSVRHTVTDPKHHRLGLMKMRIGSTAVSPDGREILVVRDKTRIELPAKTSLVCGHPACRGKRWDDEAALIKDHPSKQDMIKAGERHVYGWFSPAPLDEETSRAHAEKLLARAEGHLKLANKKCDEAKDADEMASALVALDVAEKNVAGLRKLAQQQKQQIVGYLSDEHFDAVE